MKNTIERYAFNEIYNSDYEKEIKNLNNSLDNNRETYYKYSDKYIDILNKKAVILEEISELGTIKYKYVKDKNDLIIDLKRLKEISSFNNYQFKKFKKSHIKNLSVKTIDFLYQHNISFLKLVFNSMAIYHVNGKKLQKFEKIIDQKIIPKLFNIDSKINKTEQKLEDLIVLEKLVEKEKNLIKVNIKEVNQKIEGLKNLIETNKMDNLNMYQDIGKIIMKDIRTYNYSHVSAIEESFKEGKISIDEMEIYIKEYSKELQDRYAYETLGDNFSSKKIIRDEMKNLKTLLKKTIEIHISNSNNKHLLSQIDSISKIDGFNLISKKNPELPIFKIDSELYNFISHELKNFNHGYQVLPNNTIGIPIENNVFYYQDIKSSKELLNNFKKEVIKIASEFHLNNEYKGKINNISYAGIHGPLVKELEKKHGIKLNKELIEKVHKAVKNNNKVKLKIS